MEESVYTLKKKALVNIVGKGEILRNFTPFHNLIYAICILKSFNSNITVVICSFFEFGMVSKWYIREWVKLAEP